MDVQRDIPRGHGNVAEAVVSNDFGWSALDQTATLENVEDAIAAERPLADADKLESRRCAFVMP